MCGLCLQLLTHLCARLHAEASHTRLQLFSGGYKTFAFSHRLITICFPVDIGLEALLILARNILDVVAVAVAIELAVAVVAVGLVVALVVLVLVLFALV